MVALTLAPRGHLSSGLGIFGIGPLELLIVAVFAGMCVVGFAAMIFVILFAVKHANTTPPLRAPEDDGLKCEKPPVQKQ